ncbi:MAG: class II fructose-bisphosphate aldolase [bacterium]
MNYVPMLELMQRALARGYAVPSFCVWNAESMLAVLGVATDCKSPVILMNGPGEFGLLAPRDMGTVAHALAARFAIPAALHLDHGDSLEQAQACLDAGYSSVMLDFSSRPFAENAEALRRLVAMARPRGVTVEGEIGHVGTVDGVSVEGGRDSTLTRVDEAVAYVAATGVDALAISFGNAHGNYTKLPQFDFERLAQIHAAIPLPLVLHGGSGTPDADLRRAISLGIAKVNVATESMTAVRESLRGQWDAKRNLWAPMAMAEAAREMGTVVEKWIRRTGAAGQA